MDYGDGSGVQPLTLNPDGTFALSHVYTTPGTFGVSVFVTDDDGGVGFDSAQVLVTGTADLTLAKTDSPDPVVAGTHVTYTLTVSNAGPNTAPQVVLLDELPAEVSFVSATSPQGSCGESGGTVTCQLFDLGSDAQAEVTLVVLTSTAGTITNTASVSSPAADPNPADNEATEQTTVEDAPTPPPPGECLTYPDFAPPSGLSLRGSARVEGDALRLTPAAPNTQSQVWFGSKVDVAGGFTTNFGFRFTEQGGIGDEDGPGADGITFAIQNLGVNATGNAGGSLGYDGIANSLVVELDTFNNGVGFGDPNGNHVAVHSRGTAANGPGPAGDSLLGAAPLTPLLQDGQVHEARIAYGDGTLEVYVDNMTTPALTVAVDLDQLLSLDAGTAFVGFTSATGSGVENHDVIDWSYCRPGGTVNTRPVVDAGGDATVNEGSSFSRSGSFVDPDADTWTGTVDYGDGSGVQPLALVGKTFQLAHTYADNGPFTVTVTVNDGSVSGSDSFLVTVQNVDPVVDAGPDKTIPPGGTFSSSGSFVDPGADTWTATVDYGDGSGVQPLALNADKTFALSHVYASAGVFTVTVTVTDDDGGTGTDTAVVTVEAGANTPPAVDAGGDGFAFEGTSFSRFGFFIDPDADEWTATVDYGDGSGTQSLPLGLDKSFQLEHTYADDGAHTVVVTVDDGTDTGSDSFEVTVGNVAPVVDAGPDKTIAAGETFTSAGSFTDPGADIWTATVDYGDGSGVQPLTFNPDGTFTLSHVYATAGTFFVIVNVKDDDGGEGGDFARVLVTGTADLSLTKEDSPDPVVVGTHLTYALTVTNAGPDPAPQIVVSDELPANVSFVSATSPLGSCNESGGTVTCQLFDLPSGEHAEITLTVLTSVVGTLTNTATVSSAANDPNTADNEDTEQTTVEAAPPPPPPGECLTYPDFSPPGGLSFRGSARVVGDVLRLTPAAFNTQSQVWFASKVGVAGGFATDFHFRFTDRGGIGDEDGAGADGITFAIQNVGVNTVGGEGGNLGYLGIANSLVVEFDTFNNGAFFGDPNGNHVAVHSRGTGENGPGDETFSLLGAAPLTPLMQDGAVHHARIVYDQAGELRIYVDDLSTAALTVPVQLDDLLALDAGKAFVGFTSATGSGFENHDLTDWSYCPAGTTTLAIVDAATLEGDSGSHDLSFTVSRQGSTTGTTTVDFATADGTAHQPGDYVSASGTLTFDPGETTKTITVPVNGDTVFEANETFFVNLTNASGATIADDQGVGTIENDDDQPPVAVDDTATTLEDTVLNVAAPGVLANDTDADGDALTAQLVAGLPGLTLNSDGSYTYAPPVDFNGTVSFTYRANDGTQNSNVATVTITVTPVNDAPAAVDDAASTAEDASLDVGVLANDTDVDGDTLAIDSFTQPEHGTVTQVGSELRYVPNANFHGNDSFTYTIGDGHGGFDTATVNVTVTPVNDAPDAAEDQATTAEDTPVTVDVLANDDDVDGDTLVVDSFTQAANGTVTRDGEALRYAPNANFHGSDSFTYTVGDGHGGTDTATVAITVTPVNDAPVNTVPNAQTTAEDTTLTFSALGGNGIATSDVDAGADDVEVSLGVAHGTLTLSGTAGLTFTGGGNGTSAMTFTGTLSAINTALNGLAYAPAANYNGPDTLSMTTSDLGHNPGPIVLTDTDTVAITVTAVNDAPVATDDDASGTEDIDLTLTKASLLANDTDVDLDSLSLTAVSNPTGGTVEISGDNVVFHPALNLCGQNVAGFDYAVSDGNGGTDVGRVTIDLVCVNDAPVAVDDSATTAQGATVDVDVLANDTDVENGALAVATFTQGANGTVALVAGKLRYTPNAGFGGTDTFTYRATDGELDSNIATVTITVAANVAPNAQDDSATTAEDTAVDVNVLANDTDADGDALAITAFTQPAHGTVTENANHTLHYVPAADFHGTDSFSYTISDGRGGTDTATVTIAVTPVNDAPVANDNSYSTDEDTVLNVLAPGVLGNDTDIESTALTAVLVGGPAHGLLTLNANGSFAYTPATNFNGTDSFTYRASDGELDSNVATVTITVAAVNDAPVNTVPGLQTAVEDGLLTFSALGGNAISTSDVDAAPDNVEVALGVAHGTLTLSGTTGLTFVSGANGTGAMTFRGALGAVNTALNGLVYAPAANYNGSDSLSLTTSDLGHNPGPTVLTDTDSVAITITPVNDAPVATDDDASGTEDTDVTLTTASLLANDTDVDGDPLSLTAVSNPTGGTVEIVGGNVVFHPAPNLCGDAVANFAYTVSDGSFTDTGTVTVDLTCVNDAPVAVDDSATTAQGAAVDVDVLANDTDVEGNTLEVASFSQGSNGGTVALVAGKLRYTPAPAFTGTETFTYRARDAGAESNQATVTITVVGNAPPVANDDIATTPEDTPVDVDVVANDTDADGDTLALTAVTQPIPANGTVTIVGGKARVVPNANFNGSITFGYTVSDGHGGEDTGTVVVTVTPVNDAPVAQDQSVETAEDTSKSITLGSTDVDGGAPTFTIVAGPTHGTLSGSGANRTYTPVANYNGPDSFTFRVNDGTADSNVATVSITVTPVNDAPSAANDSYTVTGGTTLTVAAPGVLANDSDLEGPVTAVLATGTANGTLALAANGSFTYTPNAGFSGTDTFTYRARDAAGAESAPATVTITVIGGGNPPTPGTPCTIRGTSQADVLTGTPGDDVICGESGNDTIDGLGGNDLIDGGQGNDRLAGGVGNDLIRGGNQIDTIDGGAGNDVIDAGNGEDTVTGGDGADQIDGFGGDDELDGAQGDDTIDGGIGNDVIRGGAGSDRANGENGNDTIRGGDGDDILDGGGGSDTLNGEAGADTIDGGNGPDVIDGGPGTDACTDGPVITNCEGARTVAGAVAQEPVATFTSSFSQPDQTISKTVSFPASSPGVGLLLTWDNPAASFGVQVELISGGQVVARGLAMRGGALLGAKATRLRLQVTRGQGYMKVHGKTPAKLGKKPFRMRLKVRAKKVKGKANLTTRVLRDKPKSR